MSNKERIFTLQGAIAIVFSQTNYDVAAVTDIPYNTITSWKFRWNRRKLSYEKQEDIVLAFGFRKVGEFRYTFPNKTLKESIDEVIENKSYV